MSVRSFRTSSIRTGEKRSKFWDQSAVVLNPAFESIASASGNGSSSSITFSSIPSTYKHLQIRMITRDTFTTFSGNYDLALQVNGVTSSVYTNHVLQGNGSTATASGGSATTVINLSRGGMWAKSPVPANTFAVAIIDIYDYASTTKNKTIRYIAGGDFNSTSGDAPGGIALGSSLYMQTTAISSITIYGAASAFATGSTFALYGIKSGA